MNDQDLLRYSRHILLDGFDIDGQEKLAKTSVLIVGAGGLGCPAAMYLAAGGVGHLILCDDDKVELSNLQRQIAHVDANIGKAKVESLAQMLKAINPTVQLTLVDQRLTQENTEALLAKVDVVLDCSDNFATRFMLNKLCLKAKKPLISGAAVRTEGQLAVFDFRDSESPCYACLYSENASADGNCSSNGVLAPLVGVIGSLQAAEAIKLLADFATPFTASLLSIDLKNNQQRRFTLAKDPDCPHCSKL